MDFASKFQAVDPRRHLYVGEQQPDIVPVLQHFQRFFRIARLYDGVPVLLQKLGGIQAQQDIVFSDKNGQMIDALFMGHAIQPFLVM
jgi:hypothetical protein